MEPLPGEDLVPLPGPLRASNRLYWGKLPGEIESDLVAIGALVPDGLLSRPSPDITLARVLEFREAYTDERKELAGAVRKLPVSVRQPATSAGQAQGKDEIERALRHIEKAVRQLEKAGRSSGILWLKRSVWVLGAFGAAAAGTVVPPLYAALFVAMSALGIGVATTVTRPGVSGRAHLGKGEVFQQVDHEIGCVLPRALS